VVRGQARSGTGWSSARSTGSSWHARPEDPHPLSILARHAESPHRRPPMSPPNVKQERRSLDALRRLFEDRPDKTVVNTSAACGRRPWGVFSGLDNPAASQQGRRVGLSCPVRRAMNLPADESTSAATQRLQQALYKAAFWRAARPELGWVLMTATPMDQPLAEARRRRIIQTAQVGFSVAIMVAIFSPTPYPSSPATES
jgi:hypothetical protein